MPRASSDWLTTWPKRPKPMISTLPCRSSAVSTPSIDCSSSGSSQRSANTPSGVSAIERITMAVRIALVVASNMPAPRRRGIEHEGELAALRDQCRAIEPSRWLGPNSRATT